MKQFFIIRIIAIIALIIALPDLGLPYGYFQLLRFFICGVSAYIAYCAFVNKHNRIGWAGVFMAILYNPLISIHLTKGIWLVMNMAAIIYIGITLRKKYRVVTTFPRITIHNT